MSYKIYTQGRTIETDSLQEALTYQKKGCYVDTVLDEFDPTAIFDDPAEYRVIGEALLIEPEKI